MNEDVHDCDCDCDCDRLNGHGCVHVNDYECYREHENECHREHDYECHREHENEHEHEHRTNVGGVSGVSNDGMVYEVDQLSFDHLVLSTDMLSAHLNNAYKAVIDSITTTSTNTSSSS